jgi:hypothetical protein
MTMPALLHQAVGGWAALYSGSAVLRTLVSFVHIAGLVSGGGAAIAADRATLRATRRGLALTRQQLASIVATHRVVVIGLTGVIVSGVLLFAADVDTYAVSKLFWLKMGMVAVLMVNGAILVRAGRALPEPDERTRLTMRRTAAVSLALWLLTTLAGAGLPNI